MNIMFESNQFFVRIKSKVGQQKITIWDNTGEKILSDMLGPDPAAQFWNSIENMTNNQVVEDIKKKL